MKKLIPLVILLSLLSSCGGGELLGIALDPPKRQKIDKSLVGVNDFFVDSQFGSISEQYSDIRSNLGLRFVRILVAWTDSVQPSPGASPNFGFYDNILNNIPAGVDVLITVVHTPSWMSDSANWINGNPRETWVKRWLEPVAKRYASVGEVVGFEVFNEPERVVVASDTALGLTSADNYFEMLRLGAASIRANAPGKKVLNAATESIQQNYPTKLDYNRRLRDLGAVDLVDVWNIHYYGTSYENVVISNGVASFLNSLGKPIWVTETGQQGPDKQLAYVETAWPFLKQKISSIERFYYYQYTDTTQPVTSNFGLRTTDSSFPVSDLYVYLRDNAS